MVVNVRQFQAEQQGQQAVLLDLVGKVLARWAGEVDAVVVGGGFNTTTCPWYCFSGLSHIRVADQRLIGPNSNAWPPARPRG